MSTLTLPFAAESKHCYEKLPRVSAIYRDGFKQLQEIAEGSGPYPERFSKLVKAHEAIIAKGMDAPSGPLMEQDVYLCCVYDLLNAWLAKEAQAAKASSGSDEEKKKALDALWAPVDHLGWSGPQWNEIEKPRLKRRLQ